MTGSADSVPSRWQRASVWMTNHPRRVGVAYTALGTVWIVVTLLFHEPDRLTFPVLFTLTGILWFGRATLRVQGRELTVPNRVWGGRRIDVDHVSAIEVPESVWSVGASWVVFSDGERLVMRGADRDRARRIAAELGVTVVPRRDG